jgi:hypothetical protein
MTLRAGSPERSAVVVLVAVEARGKTERSVQNERTVRAVHRTVAIGAVDAAMGSGEPISRVVVIEAGCLLPPLLGVAVLATPATELIAVGRLGLMARFARRAEAQERVVEGVMLGLVGAHVGGFDEVGCVTVAAVGLGVTVDEGKSGLRFMVERIPVEPFDIEIATEVLLVTIRAALIRYSCMVSTLLGDPAGKQGVTV